ncbi:hypothetical protein WA026_021189 [Henosepilachna vigintioctopunctata]|uniref:Uncharacterized protein n=1 Tax=Henosepilachna vigintioctopunctata TaxID=420089 RepID=A0AAW1UAS3_9CUCU
MRIKYRPISANSEGGDECPYLGRLSCYVEACCSPEHYNSCKSHTVVKLTQNIKIGKPCEDRRNPRREHYQLDVRSTDLSHAPPDHPKPSCRNTELFRLNKF